MEFESTNSGTTAKLPILKLGEYEMWVIRIKQYFQIQDYALWEVIENGDSWVSVPQTAQENGTSVTKMSIPVTAEEKTNKKNDVKARSLLLMALPNEHQLLYLVYIKLLEPVQVYVDDIIFGSTKKSLCDVFEGLMHKRFQMSSIRELTFFLGLQVQQKKDGIFISQEKYMADILKKFDFATVKTISTPMEPNKALIKDEEADSVDVHLYRLMIVSLMYLTASRPDKTFVVCACARDSPFELEAFSNSDYAGASLDKKSTTGDETVYKEWEDRMERAATTASSLDAEQDSGNINRT
ncbi:putative ribonuclease H-like domain-containing protein [Tanacetum coccineum]